MASKPAQRGSAQITICLRGRGAAGIFGYQVTVDEPITRVPPNVGVMTRFSGPTTRLRRDLFVQDFDAQPCTAKYFRTVFSSGFRRPSVRWSGPLTISYRCNHKSARVAPHEYLFPPLFANLPNT
jgi:hypothetical protein